MTTKTSRIPANVAVGHDLGIGIVTGRWPPGTTLMGELELAGHYNVSRGVVREALRLLAAKGLIDSRPKTGTRVRDRADWNLLDPELLGWMFEGAPPPGFVRNLFDLRLIVEPAAAERAALSRDARQLSRMGHALEMMAQHGLKSTIGQAADQQFHAALIEATRNELLVSLSASIEAAVRWTTIFKHRSSRSPRDSLPEHRALFEAIANGDATAARNATIVLLEQARDDTELAVEAEANRGTEPVIR